MVFTKKFWFFLSFLSLCNPQGILYTVQYFTEGLLMYCNTGFRKGFLYFPFFHCFLIVLLFFPPVLNISRRFFSSLLCSSFLLFYNNFFPVFFTIPCLHFPADIQYVIFLQCFLNFSPVLYTFLQLCIFLGKLSCCVL